MTFLSCLFCRIANGELPTTFRRQDADLVAFDDIHPKAPTHVLVVPKRHIESVNALTSADASLVGRLVLTAQAIARESGIADRGYKLVVNCGEEGGQVVPHLHVHLLGGKPLRDI